MPLHLIGTENGYTIAAEGQHRRVTITSGPLQGDTFRVSAKGPRGLAAAQERMTVAQRFDPPEEVAEEDLPVFPFHDSRGRRIPEEEYRRLAALEDCGRRKGKASKTAQNLQAPSNES